MPITLLAYYAAASNRQARSWLLIAASLFFYGYWDIRLTPLLIGSILANWLIAQVYARHPRLGLIVAGVAVNLLLLGIFKYADLVADTVAFFGGFQRERWNIILPLAISFFTFQQISYLVDLRRGRAPRYGLRDYALFVSFFPQLISGPIVRHHEIIPQFSLDPRRPGLAERLGRGLTMFAIGLAKKVILADELAKASDLVFAKAVAGAPLVPLEAWGGVLAYTFQLYFDFSGYSDMAIGLGLMFGFKFPFNFDAPYKATSILDFWRRWHMTLTRFMRDYLYRPIGLSLKIRFRGSIAMLITMTFIGLWHGAAWTFALFGALHGIALVINQTWRDLGWRLPPGLGWVLTFGFFALSLSLFRSESVPAALALLGAMFDYHALSPALGAVKPIKFGLIAVAAAVAFFGRTSQSIVFDRVRPSWSISVAVSGVLVYVILKARTGPSPEFIYFQF